MTTLNSLVNLLGLGFRVLGFEGGGGACSVIGIVTLLYYFKNILQNISQTVATNAPDQKLVRFHLGFLQLKAT
jgi:hypothetical protein